MEGAAETLETLLTEEQMQRYSRQILLEQVGV
jgi:molybdopterin/thiamine biosynthesis adenylyltransferase